MYWSILTYAMAAASSPRRCTVGLMMLTFWCVRLFFTDTGNEKNNIKVIICRILLIVFDPRGGWSKK